MTKISFELFGLELLEPMAFLLNWVLMYLSVRYFLKLKKDVSERFSLIFIWFFFFMSISFCLGGLTHLFYNYTGQVSKIPGWTAAILAISAVEYSVTALMNQKTRSFVQGFIVSKLGITLALTFSTLSFGYVMIHTSFLIPFLLIPLTKDKNTFSYFGLGILLLLAALPVKLAGLDLHLWFNRDDISHVFMMGTLWSFFQGVKIYELNQRGVKSLGN